MIDKSMTKNIYPPQFGSTENWNSVFLMQVTNSSPSSSCPSLQVRDRTVPVKTGNCFSAVMLIQVVLKPVQTEIYSMNNSKTVL